MYIWTPGDVSTHLASVVDHSPDDRLVAIPTIQKQTMFSYSLCRRQPLEASGQEANTTAFFLRDQSQVAAAAYNVHSPSISVHLAIPLGYELASLLFHFSNKVPLARFKVTEGADLLTSYHHTRAGPRRTFCKR